MRVFLLAGLIVLASGCARYDAHKTEEQYLALKGKVFLTYVEHCQRSKDVLAAWSVAGSQDKIDEWTSKAATACNYASIVPGSGY